MQNGIPVVYVVGNDNAIYRTDNCNGDTCTIISYMSGVKYNVGIPQIREATDTELMIGYRMKE